MSNYEPQAEKVLIKEWNSIYVTIPKTGCTTFKKIISDHFDFKIKSNVHNIDSEIYEHVFHDTLLDTRYRDYFKFAFVRNPFSRLFSAYKSKVRPGVVHDGWIDGVEKGIYKMGIRQEHSFDEFIDIVCSTDNIYCDPHVKPQWEFIHNQDLVSTVDRIYKFESLEASIKEYFQDRGIHILCVIPHENRTQDSPDEYKNSYSADSLNRVLEKYELDFTIFDYPTSLS